MGERYNLQRVLNQLRYTGILDTVRVRSSGFAVRKPFAEFLQEYIKPGVNLLPEDTQTRFQKDMDDDVFAATLLKDKTVENRAQQIGGSGGSLEPPGPLLEPPGPLLTHFYTVYIAYSERLPTRLNPLAERACFSQVENTGLDKKNGTYKTLCTAAKICQELFSHDPYGMSEAALKARPPPRHPATACFHRTPHTTARDSHPPPEARG
jgi:hypothetical protein